MVIHLDPQSPDITEEKHHHTVGFTASGGRSIDGGDPQQRSPTSSLEVLTTDTSAGAIAPGDQTESSHVAFSAHSHGHPAATVKAAPSRRSTQDLVTSSDVPEEHRALSQQEIASLSVEYFTRPSCRTVEDCTVIRGSENVCMRCFQ
jgi:hypothetical protein